MLRCLAIDKLIGDTDKILRGYIRIRIFTHTQVEKSKRWKILKYIRANYYMLRTLTGSYVDTKIQVKK